MAAHAVRHQEESHVAKASHRVLIRPAHQADVSLSPGVDDHGEVHQCQGHPDSSSDPERSSAAAESLTVQARGVKNATLCPFAGSGRRRILGGGEKDSKMKALSVFLGLIGLSLVIVTALYVFAPASVPAVLLPGFELG